MWIFTPIGFFSAIRHRDSDVITIRARVRSDLLRLRANYLPTASEVIALRGTDYPYRVTCSPVDWKFAVAEMADDVTYPNFKSEVARVQGRAREAAYHEVWATLLNLEATEGNPNGLRRPAVSAATEADLISNDVTSSPPAPGPAKAKRARRPVTRTAKNVSRPNATPRS